MSRIEYSSNNSGGRWWLQDDAWHALEAAGWTVDWRDGRWLGALATRAHKDGFASMRAGVDEWERVTSACSTDAGCPCCGPPHYFSFTADDSTREFCPHTSYEGRW